MSETTYIVEYATSGRSKCKAGKSCADPTIKKGDLRWGTAFESQSGTPMTTWRHWDCVTTKVLHNVKAKVESLEELSGFESLNDEDKEKIKSAWDAGEMPSKPAPAEAPEDDAQDEEDGERKSKPRGAKTAAAAKKEAAAAKKEPAKRKKTKADEEDKESAEGTESDEESKPKKKKAAPKKKGAATAKAPARKKAATKKKADDDEE
ncbi:hypothetical protein HDU90_007819 [Geranomyces variabilis]|nr:hypothetical protein HDU90_007819 [Geranomyces variabilis]